MSNSVLSLTDEQKELIKISCQVGAATGADFRNSLNAIMSVKSAYSGLDVTAAHAELVRFVEENFTPGADAILKANELGVEI